MRCHNTDMNIGTLFNTILIQPIFNILLVFMFVLSTWRIPGALGFSIIGLTALFRLIFAPMYKKQIEMAMHMEELRPQLEKIQKKYKGNAQKIQQEQLKLYQARGLNPASGCLVGLLQIPLVIALYQVLLKVFEKDGAKYFTDLTTQMAYTNFLRIKSIDPWFFGFNLAYTPSQFQQHGPHYLLIPIITAALQYWQIASTQKATPKKQESAEKDTKDGKPREESFQEVFQKQSKFMFPMMVGYFSYILPVGLALYWNVFSLFSIFQAQQQKTWKTKQK